MSKAIIGTLLACLVCVGAWLIFDKNKNKKLIASNLLNIKKSNFSVEISNSKEVRLDINGVKFTFINIGFKNKPSDKCLYFLDSEITAEQFQLKRDNSYLAQLPITQITFFEAQKYANELSETTGLQIRLPVKDEWLLAAYGTENRAYPWGEDERPAAYNNSSMSYSKDGERLSSKNQFATSKTPNKLFDMWGNASEFVYAKYSFLDEVDFDITWMGGSYLDENAAAQKFWGFSHNREYKNQYTGFRLVLVKNK